MAYVFTNIVSLPWYTLKFELIKTTGTGSNTVTGGGYIKSISKIAIGVDEINGEVKIGACTLNLLNTGNEFSTNIFTSSIDQIELRVWVSYDGGTTYDATAAFAGFANLGSIRDKDSDWTETRNRMYECQFVNALMMLRTIEIDFDAKPVTYFTAPSAIPFYTTDEDGTLRAMIELSNEALPTYGVKFATFENILKNIAEQIPWTSGYVPTVVNVDYSELDHRFLNATTATSVDISKACLFYEPTNPTGSGGSYLASFANPWAGPLGAYEAKNYLEWLKKFTQSMAIVPIPRLWNNAGTLTFTLHLTCRASSTLTTMTANVLGVGKERGAEAAPFVDMATFLSIGLPVRLGTYSRGSAQQITVNNIFYTNAEILNPVVDPYLLFYLYAKDVRPGPDPYHTSKNNYPSAGQVFINTTGTTVKMCHQMKILFSQSMQTPSTADMYGFQNALYDALYESTSYAMFKRGRQGMSASYKTIKGSNLWDLRPLRRYSVRSSDRAIIGVERDLTTNTSAIKYVDY